MQHTAVLALLWALTLPASGQTFQSGPDRVPLLELYTSEGCSSCPSADRWFTGLKDESGLWSRFVPVALHVDYWNYLGWDDRFADARHSQRQRRYRRQGYVSAVYTPGVMLGGEEWRDWRRQKKPRQRRAEAVGELELSVDDGRYVATFDASPSVTLKDPTLHVALLGFGLESEVRAGENRGRSLSHDFVVLQVTAVRSPDKQWTGPLPRAPGSDAQRLGLAAWVSDGADVRPIQAVGGWLTP